MGMSHCTACRALPRTVALCIAIASAPGFAAAAIPADCQQDADLALKLFACTAFIGTETPDQDQAEALYERARVHLQRVETFSAPRTLAPSVDDTIDAEWALEDARGAIRLAPLDVRYWIAAGHLLLKTQQTAAASAYFDRAEDIGAKPAEVLLARAAVRITYADYDEAEAILAEALALDPGNVAALRMRARAAFEQGEFQAYLRMSEDAVRIVPDQAVNHLDSGIASLLTDDQSRAKLHLEEALRLDPNLAEAHLYLGRMHLWQGRADAARDALKAAIALDPKYPEAHAYLGMALTQLGETKSAQAAFDEVVRLAPLFVNDLTGTSRAWMHRGRPDLMMESFDLAVLIEPQNTWLLRQRAELHEELGDSAAGIADLTLAIEIELRKPETYDDLIWIYEARAKAYLESKNPDAAVADFRAALDVQKPRARWEACFSYANDLRKAGILDSAREFYETCLQSDPGNPNGNFGYAAVLADEGKLDDAIPLFAAALRVAKGRQIGFEDFWNVLSHRAEALLDNGDAASALKVYTLLVQAKPEDSEAQEDLARSVRALGDLPRAIKEYDKAIALDPQNRTAWRYRGDCFADLGDAAAAIADYTQAIEVDPRYKQAYKRRGDILVGRLDDHAAAIADYTKALEIDSDYVAAREARRDALYATGQYEGALADVDRLIETSAVPEPGYHQTRGRIYRMLGNAEGAIADFRRARDLGDAYSAMYLFLIRRVGDPAGASEELRGYAATLSDGKWPQPIMAHLLGDLSLESLSARASGDGELCEAKFYGGWLLLLQDQPAEAKALFHEVAGICPRDFIEYEDALNELARLGETEPF